MSKQLIILGLGSNIDPLTHLRRSLSELKKCDQFKILQIASIYKSDALLLSEHKQQQNSYLNSALLIELNQFLTPVEILKIIKNIEIKMGRVQSERWAPRVIDIDLLWMQNQAYSDEVLTVPHIGVHQRPFVYFPLFEVVFYHLNKNSEFKDMLSVEQKIEAVEKLTQFNFAQELKNELILNEFKNLMSVNSQLPFKTHVAQDRQWPVLVGILNLTEDSFSDGGYLKQDKKLQHQNLLQKIGELTSEGAEVLDFGAESTRPGALTIDQASELKILDQALHIFFQDHNSNKIKTSIDTRKYFVISALLKKYKIDYINDVEGFRDLNYLKSASEYLKQNKNAKLVCMHSFSVPHVKNEHIPLDQSVFNFLKNWWSDKVNSFQKQGVQLDQVIFDVGIGFGKTPLQNFEIIQNLEKFDLIKESIYIGHSRKSFIVDPAVQNKISNLLKTKDFLNSESQIENQFEYNRDNQGENKNLSNETLVNETEENSLFTSKQKSEQRLMQQPAQRDEITALLLKKMNLAYVQYVRVHNVKLNLKALVTKFQDEFLNLY